MRPSVERSSCANKHQAIYLTERLLVSHPVFEVARIPTTSSTSTMADASWSESESDYSMSEAPMSPRLPTSTAPTDRASRILAARVAWRALHVVGEVHKGHLNSYEADALAAQLAESVAQTARQRLMWPQIPALHAWVILNRAPGGQRSRRTSINFVLTLRCSVQTIQPTGPRVWN